MSNGVETILKEFFQQLMLIFSEVKSPEVSVINKAEFFKSVRGSLFSRLSKSQVQGIEAKLDVLLEKRVPLSHAAYILATSYHETAKTMQPVREGLKASDAWRKRNLRYYPWYGRGDVQLTWESNYKKADEELGLNGELVKNPDLALDPVISAKVLVVGSQEGWFSGDSKGRHTLSRHLPKPEGTFEQFARARRIINLMDRANLIAGYAVEFQKALKRANYSEGVVT